MFTLTVESTLRFLNKRMQVLSAALSTLFLGVPD